MALHSKAPAVVLHDHGLTPAANKDGAEAGLQVGHGSTRDGVVCCERPPGVNLGDGGQQHLGRLGHLVKIPKDDFPPNQANRDQNSVL